MSDSSLVMKGLLSEFALADVLQVVSLSRQFTAIELRKLDGKRHGIIWIKSGQVIGAQRGSVQGRRAFSELVRSVSETFAVWRLQDPPTYNPPLGRIPELLASALDGQSRPEGSHAGPQPLPLPPPPRRTTTAVVSAVDVRDTEIPVDGEAKRWNRTTWPDSDGEGAPAPRLSVVEAASQNRTSQIRPRPTTAALRSGLVVAVCSPKGGVGKTTIALNLSVSLAQRGLKTVLVDADINGDQLSLLNARDRVALGAYDILGRPDALDQALRDTASANLRFLPASGADLDFTELQRGDQSDGWRAVLEGVSTRADISLVDCPAGMLGVTHDVLSSASHVIGVFQSEMVARRSFTMFMRGLEAIPAEQRPQLLGVVVNMFHRQSGPSLEAFYGICDEGDGYRLFETTIPRSEAFAEASLAGQPLRCVDDGENPSPVAWLFDMLADEVCTRFEPRRAAPKSATPRPFLL